MIDQIHNRYVLYLNQTSAQRDATKTDYTYAKTYSYRRDIKIWLINQWLVPNLCRKSIDFVSNAELTPESKMAGKLAKLQNYDNYSKEFKRKFLSDTTTADKRLQSKIEKRRAYKLLPICSLLFMVLVSLICLTALLSNTFLIKHLIHFCETIRPENQINNLREELPDIKHNLSFNKYLSQCLNEKSDSDTFCLIMYYTGKKQVLTSEYGRLQIVRLLSNEDQNAFTALYNFKVDEKLNVTEVHP